jgi:hypothetical protein
MIAAELHNDLPFLIRVFRLAAFVHRRPSDIVIPHASEGERLAFDQHVLAAGEWAARQGNGTTEVA